MLALLPGFPKEQGNVRLQDPKHQLMPHLLLGHGYLMDLKGRDGGAVGVVLLVPWWEIPAKPKNRRWDQLLPNWKPLGRKKLAHHPN